METSTYIPPTPEQRCMLLTEYGFEYEQRIREDKCKTITSLSRSTRWALERKGAFPARQYMGKNSCTWLLSDVLWWVRNPPAISGVSNPYERKKEKEAKGAGII